MDLSPLPKLAFLANNGRPAVGYKLFTYEAGTTNKLATYTDASGGSQNTNPIRLDFRGEAGVWLDPTLTYKFVLSPPTDTDPPTHPIWTVDDIATGLTIADITQQFIGKLLWPRTPAEAATGVTPVSYAYPPGDVRRYVTNSSPGTTDCGAGLRNAHLANIGEEVVYQGEEYYTTIPIPFYSLSKYRGIKGSTIISTDQNIPICVSASYLSSLSSATVSGNLDIYGIEARGSDLTLTTGTAQAGASTTITLDAGASSDDDAYNNMMVQITGGTGKGQCKIIRDYVGSTKVATVDGGWNTNPDNTSTYRISYQIGWIIRDYYVYLNELIARDCGGGGFVLNNRNDADVAVSGTLVEGRVGKLVARECGGPLFYFGANGNGDFTDWECDHLLAQADSSTGLALYIGQASGWRIGRPHIYGTTLPEPVEIIAPFKTSIWDMYLESYTTTGVRVSNLQEGLFLHAQMDAAQAAASSNAVRVSRSGAETNTPIQVFLNIDMESNANSCNGLNLVNSSIVCTGAVLVGGTNASNMTPVVTSSSDTTDVSIGTVSGTYTATLTGVTATVTGSAVWSKKAKNVDLYLPQLTGTSNSTACTITGMPTAIRPTRSQFVAALVEDNSTLAWGGADIATDGTITLYPTAALGTFTAAGTKGVRKITLSYSLA